MVRFHAGLPINNHYSQRKPTHERKHQRPDESRNEAESRDRLGCRQRQSKRATPVHDPQKERRRQVLRDHHPQTGRKHHKRLAGGDQHRQRGVRGVLREVRRKRSTERERGFLLRLLQQPEQKVRSRRKRRTTTSRRPPRSTFRTRRRSKAARRSSAISTATTASEPAILPESTIGSAASSVRDIPSRRFPRSIPT